MKKPVVAIAKNTSIAKAVFEAMSRIDLPDLDGKKILLKPNVGRNVGKNLGINTSPTVVHAVYRFLKERYKAEFFLGDSPILGVNSPKAFVNSGYEFLMKKKDITFVDLDAAKPVEFPIRNGRILKKIKLVGTIEDYDYIISIPVLKMHMHTGASLSFKNMKGVIYRREKVKLHQLHAPEKIRKGDKELDIGIADLAYVIKPDLAVIDAFYAQEGMGPSAGSRKRLNTIIVSDDFLAADVTALTLVNLDIEHTPHLKLISKQTSGVSSINEIRTIPDNIKPFQTDFEIPPTEVKIEDKKINLIDVSSCSACLSSVFLFIKNNEPMIQNYFNEYGQLNLAIGKDVKDIPEGSVIVGNCAKHEKHKGLYIKGCPPSQTIMKIEMQKMLDKKKKVKLGKRIKNRK